MKRPPEDARMQAMLEVWAGRRTATAAAETLGMSRKTFYQWEARALQALRQSLTRGRPGRPRKEKDPQKTEQERVIRRLRDDLAILQQRDRIRTLLAEPMTRAQRNQAATTVWEIIQALHQHTGQSFRRLIPALGLARSSVFRWAGRLRREACRHPQAGAADGTAGVIE